MDVHTKTAALKLSFDYVKGRATQSEAGYNICPSRDGCKMNILFNMFIYIFKTNFILRAVVGWLDTSRKGPKIQAYL